MRYNTETWSHDSLQNWVWGQAPKQYILLCACGGEACGSLSTNPCLSTQKHTCKGQRTYLYGGRKSAITFLLPCFPI